MFDVHKKRVTNARIEELSVQEGDQRQQRLSLRVGPIFADFSRQHCDLQALDALLQHAVDLDLPAAIAGLLAGDKLNLTEQRSALHTLLRQPYESTGGGLAQQFSDIAKARAQSRHLINSIRELRSAENKPIRHVINVGIGGSDLGPRLLLDALPSIDPRIDVHFVSSVDAHAIEQLIATLNPSETLVVLVSKSFSTQETLLNGAALIAWLQAALGEARAKQHVFAVSANTRAAIEFGVNAEHVMPIWDWIGGRYSIWSAVGFSASLALGIPTFEQFLTGAHVMDKHFASAPLAHNLPVISALLGYWNRSVLGYSSLCVVPYDPRLRVLPNYLQQLEMESNGKSVRLDGSSVDVATTPVIWGGVGTDAQHAFFQALHQGTDVIPVDFIGVVNPDHARQQQHNALLANLLAQSAALAVGTAAEENPNFLAQHRHHPGNRPSSVYLLDSLSAEAIGGLLALYEHKVFVQSRLWGINAFDQWGVELGKHLARSLEPALAGTALDNSIDEVTRRLIQEIHRRR